MKLRTVLVAVALVVATGCKVRVTVPEGGEVNSVSGSFHCGAGEVCEFDVSDIHFDETYVATPAAGKAFVGWEPVAGGLCGRSGKPCRLVTSGFSAFDVLMDVLASDSVYHLRPYFTDVAKGGSLSLEPMRNCSIDSFLKTGYKTDLTSRIYTDDGVLRGTKRSRSEVLGPTTFEGQAVVERLEQVEEDTGFEVSYELRAYTRVDEPGKRATVIAVDQLSLSPAPQEVESRLVPGFEQRFRLGLGETYTTEHVATLTFPNGESPPISSDSRTVATYEGIERITTPAGTFDACRIHRFDTQDGHTSESYHWWDKNTGVLLRQSNGAFVVRAEVVSGTVNGKAL